MATKTFTIDLNGGDVETPNIDLIFKIYGAADGYVVPIATLSEALNPSQVSITGDILTLSNIEIGSESSFKVADVDADGNESEKSDVYTTAPTEVNIGYVDSDAWGNNFYSNMRANKFTMTENGTFISLSINLESGNNNQLLMGIYADNAGSPGALLATTASLFPTVTGINTLNLLTQPYLTSGTSFWITFSAQGVNIKARSAELGGIRATSDQATYFNPLPDPFGSSTISSFEFGLYGTYTT